MIKTLELPKEGRMAIICPSCGKIDYFYNSISPPFNCSKCYKVYINTSPLWDSVYFRLLYYQNGSVTKHIK